MQSGMDESKEYDMEFIKVYDTSVNDWNLDGYHRVCDDVGHNVTIAQYVNGDYIGGYLATTSLQDIDNKNMHRNDFLFRLDTFSVTFRATPYRYKDLVWRIFNFLEPLTNTNTTTLTQLSPSQIGTTGESIKSVEVYKVQIMLY
jgi:hypothetical protein